MNPFTQQLNLINYTLKIFSGITLSTGNRIKIRSMMFEFTCEHTDRQTQRGIDFLIFIDRFAYYLERITFYRKRKISVRIIYVI